MEGRFFDALLFIALASFWALNYPVLKIALGYDNPYAILFFRILFAAVSSAAFFHSRLKFPHDLGTNLKILGVGLLVVVSFMSLWFLGESLEPAALSSILVYSYPVFTILLSWIFLSDPYSTKKAIATAIGFAGVVLIFVEQIRISSFLGVAFLLLAAIFWASGTIFFKKYLTQEDPATVTTVQLIYGLPVIFLIALLYNPAGIFNPGMNTILLSLIIGIPGTSVSYYIYFHLFKKYDVSEISSYLFAIPALSIAFSFLILGEKNTVFTYIGYLLISAGIFISYHSNASSKGKVSLNV